LARTSKRNQKNFLEIFVFSLQDNIYVAAPARVGVVAAEWAQLAVSLEG
jgi:hypothetical protein